MPAYWIKSVDDGTGTVEISNGKTFNLSDIPGNGWPQQRLNKLNDFVQSLIDHRMRQSDLPLDDPERNWDAAQFTAQYGNRRFLDGQDVVSRSARIWFTIENGELLPHSEVVR